MCVNSNNMEFCNYCNNMLYINLDDDKNMIKFCKNCGNKIVHKKEAGSKVIIEDNQIDDDTKYAQYNTPNIKFDRTLPRVNNIKCENEHCSTNKKENPTNREVIYIKYDDKNMRYLYHCVTCEHTWRSK